MVEKVGEQPIVREAGGYTDLVEEVRTIQRARSYLVAVAHATCCNSLKIARRKMKRERE